MRLFGRRLRQAYSTRGATVGSWRRFAGPGSYGSQEALGTPGAYEAPVVYACVSKISHTLSTLPRKVRRVSDNEEATAPFWVEQPNSYMGGADFIKAATTSLLLWGEAFVLPFRNPRGETSTVAVANPQYVSHLVQGGAVRWYINGVEYSGEIIHLRNDALPGRLRGVPIYDVMRPLTETNRVAQQYIYKVVEQAGAYQLAVLYPEDVDAGDDVVEDTMLQVMSRHAGPDGAYLPLVLAGGAQVVPINQSNADGQFVDLSDQTAKNIAQFYFHIDDTIMGFKSNQPQHYQNAPSVWYRYWTFACAHLHAEIQKAYTLMLPRALYMDIDASEMLVGGPHDRAKMAMELAEVNKKTGLWIYTADELRQLTGKHPLPEYEPMATTAPVPEAEDEGDDTGGEDDDTMDEPDDDAPQDGDADE